MLAGLDNKNTCIWSLDKDNYKKTKNLQATNNKYWTTINSDRTLQQHSPAVCQQASSGWSEQNGHPAPGWSAHRQTRVHRSPGQGWRQAVRDEHHQSGRRHGVKEWCELPGNQFILCCTSSCKITVYNTCTWWQLTRQSICFRQSDRDAEASHKLVNCVHQHYQTGYLDHILLYTFSNLLRHVINCSFNGWRQNWPTKSQKVCWTEFTWPSLNPETMWLVMMITTQFWLLIRYKP